MTAPRSLQLRLGLSLALLLTLLWAAAASVTAVLLRHEMDRMFDSSLQETAQRLLPLAVVDILGREDDGITLRLSSIRPHDEFFTYIVRDTQGRILLQSHAAQPDVFPPYSGRGFTSTPTHRLYSDDAVQGSLSITVAEPLAHRNAVARKIMMGLGLPLLFVVPAALAAIALALRAGTAPLRRFRERLAARNARDLSALAVDDLPAEVAPLARTLNDLLSRLEAAFEAERSFAANAAHELRTPLAGAIAQAQRLQRETTDPAAAQRAADIEATLKRLTRRAERLMQLARAEGAQLRRPQAADLRPVLRIVVEDLTRATAPGRLRLHLPPGPVLSDLDPDAFGILCRNLVENALRHGDPAAPVEVTLTAAGALRVENDGPIVPPQVMARLGARFERGTADGDGSGLGLSIVAAIAARIGSRLDLASPRPGAAGGFAASVTLPVTNAA